MALGVNKGLLWRIEPYLQCYKHFSLTSANCRTVNKRARLAYLTGAYATHTSYVIHSKLRLDKCRKREKRPRQQLWGGQP